MERKIFKCVIIDDEPAAHYVLSDYIDRNPNLSLAKQCYNALEAIDFLRNNTADLLFLDINMPEISGLDFLKIINQPPKTILTTAYSEYALESYEYDVIDYLLKPISSARFLKAIERFLQNSNIENSAIEEPKSLSIHIDGQSHDINLDTILYIQSYGNYVKIHTKLKVFLASITTQEFLSQIPSSKFIRIHKSYIVPLNKIIQFQGNFVVLGEIKLPVGITYKRELQERLSH